MDAVSYPDFAVIMKANTYSSYENDYIETATSGQHVFYFWATTSNLYLQSSS
ncbi:hypothetical protein TCARB_0247 [Thermofilum adornatum 1505]|uniref:Uncharacterized protein n=1 Tax=Thermofilum adornatum 1505 TaxID=697581 RepID=A0A3G1A5P2_9CREN|nr:hypothetical protein TCARB_0247 [Thermofilum adornatum 1505]